MPVLKYPATQTSLGSHAFIAENLSFQTGRVKVEIGGVDKRLESEDKAIQYFGKYSAGPVEHASVTKCSFAPRVLKRRNSTKSMK